MEVSNVADSLLASFGAMLAFTDAAAAGCRYWDPIMQPRESGPEARMVAVIIAPKAISNQFKPS